MKNLHAVIKPPRVSDTFADLLIFNINKSRPDEIKIIKTIIHYLSSDTKQNHGKNIVILIMDDNYRKYG